MESGCWGLQMNQYDECHNDSYDHNDGDHNDDDDDDLIKAFVPKWEASGCWGKLTANSIIGRPRPPLNDNDDDRWRWRR